jgi:hypothetical protein
MEYTHLGEIGHHSLRLTYSNLAAVIGFGKTVTVNPNPQRPVNFVRGHERS